MVKSVSSRTGKGGRFVKSPPKAGSVKSAAVKRAIKKLAKARKK